ncbi:MAG: ABC transporter substrate-binding protein [Alphaproteobacteria bacterium]|nr:ABC transporter substrate-binding protein [Alphaproteobacteria bacterium]MDE2112939.1 ABC transporter substrate-binding protein [Alphaproteobacteria bacterium]MDE2495913.1 ABC transporter substrate-binding protein [Alphaproteobacteria bacterium]
MKFSAPLLAFAVAFAAPAAAAPKLTRIVFVTDWKAQAEHGGFYEALALGLYKQRGLDVRIREGGPSVNVPQMIAGGAADFGIGSNSFVALNLAKQGVPVRAVMAVFQKDPAILMTHPRPDVKTLAQMRDKPIMLGDTATVTIWPWLKAKYGFSDSQIRKYTFNLAPFLVDQSAIQEGYLTSEPFTVEQTAHFEPQVFLLADDGYTSYANLVLVPQRWIDKNPAAVQAFYDASRDGWREYLNGDPRPANALIKRDNPDMSDAVIAQSIAKMKGYGLVWSGDAKVFGIGAMTNPRWKNFFTTMSGLGLYPKNLPYEKAYDLTFMRNAPQYFQ